MNPGVPVPPTELPSPICASTAGALLLSCCARVATWASGGCEPHAVVWCRRPTSRRRRRCRARDPRNARGSHRASCSGAGASEGAGAGAGTSFIDFLNSLSALPSALPISGRRRGPKINRAITPTMNNSGQWNPMVLLLRLFVGVGARVRAGQPAAQARILRKLDPQPLERCTGFGLAPEGVERVGREPAAAEAQPRLFRDWPEPSEDFEGT